MKKISQILFYLFFVFLIAVSWQVVDFVLSPPSADMDEYDFEVPPGASFGKIANQLESDGFIRDAFRFKIYAKIRGDINRIRVGEYSIRKNMTPGMILDEITSGKSKSYSLTFQEGINMYEIAELLEKKKLGKKSEFLKLCRDKEFIADVLGEDVPSLEGYLFPETYNVTKFTSEKELIRVMVKKFINEWKEVKPFIQVDLSRHQIVTLASVIEKETGAPEERPIISSVFHNRLRKKMKLQSDPTIMYGILDETGVMPTNIRKKDILESTKYNTYTVKALPYGPIANPGKDAMLAAVRPKETDYLYFVSKNNGTHTFSRTYKEHSQAVRKYQLDRKARQGKSWRDLNKKNR